jgi:hypothetical protein
LLIARKLVFILHRLYSWRVIRRVIHGAFSRDVLAAFIAAFRTPQRKVRDMRKLFIIGLLAAPLSLGTAYAQATTTPAAKAAPKPRTAASMECSKRADAQNLHGKERKKFRANCKKELAKKG